MKEKRSPQVRRLTSEYIEHQERQKEERERRMKGVKRRLSVFGGFLGAFIIFAVITLFQQHSAIQDQEHENSQLELQLADIKDEEEALEEKVEALHDPEYIAELARRDFFMSKPGETLFQLPRSQEVEE
ncbi:MAG: septum formation initiator family protein [Alkalicoccus sp.]|nr:MAG: septum formation initiator family protein [Alkalicoccus sp.]